MLFDEKDFRVFDNVDSCNYFKEILQSYYGQNYRATIVLLYSFVIYDLFIKMQNMANEGDKKAKNKLKYINNMITDDEKYSKVENEIIQFFKDNCPLYFDKFIEDIDYLKNCRNKCAHLKVNDNSLYVPSDYHARMLICSMYDNILSVKAPFIMDLFSIAKEDVEMYSNRIFILPNNVVDESIKETIVDKYLKRMTYDSIKKSYKTFIRLLFVSEAEDCINNLYGLFAFVFSMTDYIIKNGQITLLNEASILDVFSRINIDSLKKSDGRITLLIELITKYPQIMDIFRDNKDVFEYISKKALIKPYGLNYYRAFYPREQRTAYEYFKEHISEYSPSCTQNIYESVKECEDFNVAEYLLLMVKSIPSFNGFYDADCYMAFFKEHLSELEGEDIEKIMSIYNSNNQCKNRNRHFEDILFIEKYIKERKINLDNKENLI